MSTVTILHNPRCSKSRETLNLLNEKGIDVQVVEYLKQPLSVDELKSVFARLPVSDVVDMMRTKEAEYKAQGLDNPAVDDETRFKAMFQTPKLMERPIVFTEDAARIGRPPESVLELF